MSASPSANPRPRRPRWLLLAGCAALGLIGAGVAWKWQAGRDGPIVPPRVEAPDPRMTFQTPYRNVRPDVKYVGDQACADCHHNHAKHYSHHPMGEALA